MRLGVLSNHLFFSLEARMELIVGALYRNEGLADKWHYYVGPHPVSGYVFCCHYTGKLQRFYDHELSSFKLDRTES